MKKLSLFLLLISNLFSQGTGLKLSEIMFYPVGENNEFIELYNNSSYPIYLNNYQIKYYGVPADTIKDAGYGTLLQPHQYAVVLEKDYDIYSGIYKNLIPADALILKIADNYFGTSGMSNSTSHIINLCNQAGTLLDSYQYSANNKEGYSDELMAMQEDSSLYWHNSIVQNGTPGFKNSATRNYYDLAIDSLTVSSDKIFVNSSSGINIYIKNKGIFPAEGYSIKVFNDLNHDSTAGDDEVIFNNFYTLLNQDDSLLIKVNYVFNTKGMNNICCKIETVKDNDVTNNFIEKDVFVNGPPDKNIVINEIMYDPPSGESEWIELYNKGEYAVNLNGYTINDLTSKKVIINSDYFLPSRSYLVIANDTLFKKNYKSFTLLTTVLPSLNNSGDIITLKDADDFTIDSINYAGDWGAAGKSIEKLEPTLSPLPKESWNVCLYTGTPGRVNSLTKKNFDLSIENVVLNKSYFINGEQIQGEIVVKNKGLNLIDNAVLLIKSVDASLNEILVKTIEVKNIQPNEVREINLNLDNAYTGRVNLKVESSYSQDEDIYNNEMNFQTISINRTYTRNDLVLNEIMYKPGSSNCEWLELYNNKANDIILGSIKIADEIDTLNVKLNKYIKAKSYLIVAADSLKFISNKYKGDVVFSRLPFLNNDGDKIILLDSLNYVLDSIRYEGSKTISDYSLERINSLISSTDTSNWKMSKYISGTPGYINSNTQKEYDEAIDSAHIEFDSIRNVLKVIINIGNKGSKEIPAGKIYFYKLSQSNYSIIDSSDIPSIAFNNNIVIEKEIQTGDSVTIFLNIINPYDQESYNDTLTVRYIKKYDAGKLVINEIMFYTKASNVEWIELYNNGSGKLNLKYFNLLKGTYNYKLSKNDYILNQGEYVVLVNDSTSGIKNKLNLNFGKLNNSTETLKIIDDKGDIIDSLTYNGKEIFFPDYSLERIDANKESVVNNFHESISGTGSTPGEVNSFAEYNQLPVEQIYINEILFDPSSGNNKFIELYNAGSSPLFIGGSTITTGLGYSLVSNKASFIEPGGYYLISDDTLAYYKYGIQENENKNNLGVDLKLDKTNDFIVLKNFKNQTIDSVNYYSYWHNNNSSSSKDISLEKKSYSSENTAESWGSSIDPKGATPLKQNSLSNINRNNSDECSISPNPFSPDNDGYEDVCNINLNFNKPVNEIILRIFDAAGRQMKYISNYLNIAKNNLDIYFDGKDQENKTLRIGIYIFYFQIKFSDGSEKYIKKPVVVALRK